MMVCLAGITLFASCDKDKDKDKEGNDNEGSVGNYKITATNVQNSSPGITTVKFEIYSMILDDYNIIAQAPYQNNGFTLELPATLANNYLYPLISDAPNGIVISDNTAKVAVSESIDAYDSNAEFVGNFIFQDSEEEAYSMWFYVDKNVIVQGETRDVYEDYDEEYIGKYDMVLKKGWNIVYSTESYNFVNGRTVYTYTTSTQKPAGVNYQWYFSDGYYNKTYASVNREQNPTVKRNPFFTKKTAIPHHAK